MSTSGSKTQNKGQVDETYHIMLALFVISASTIMVEITLTKFLAFKFYYHYTYAVISLVIFALALAGIFVYFRTSLHGRLQHWGLASKSAYIYAISLMTSVVVFAWLPITLQKNSLFTFSTLLLCFFVLGIPFFFAGICISYTLYASRKPVMEVLFFDLLGAGLGALISPFLLYKVGGYGLVASASGLGILSSLLYLKGSTSKFNLHNVFFFLLLLTIFLAYPGWAVKRYDFDIRSPKDAPLKNTFIKDFGGISFTNWNVISRIDVSGTGDAKNYVYRYGLARKHLNDDIPGRLITVDGSAHTRQFKPAGNITKKGYLKTALWASPYVVNLSSNRVLVIGGGGGLDILVAKYFMAKSVDVVEINPFTYKLLTGDAGCPECNHYSKWLISNGTTQVDVFNDEGRHFATKSRGFAYDIIQASGVDTLTAITTGGRSLVENYLYTLEAVGDYWKVLDKNGVLSLTHWRHKPPSMALRMFLTYLKHLELTGISNPLNHIVVIGGVGWTDSLLKRSPFTREELDCIKTWAMEAGYDLLFDPSVISYEKLSLGEDEDIYYKIAFAGDKERQEILNSYTYDVTPVTDDKPYFYRIIKLKNLLSLFEDDFYVCLVFVVSVICSVFLVIIPGIFIKGELTASEKVVYPLSFALCGFAFLLLETSLIQKLTVLVGGPTYSLIIVLVCVLVGYAFGSYISRYVRSGYTIFFILGVLLFVLLFTCYLSLAILIKQLLPLPFVLRAIPSGLISFFLSALAAMPVTLGMYNIQKLQRSAVSWMWGTSSAFNVVGGISFVPLSQSIGITNNFLVIMFCYLIASILLGYVVKDR